MQDLVSIVVPVYNVAQYLDRCLISLTGQTHSNIEILLVNDGSTDASGEICDAWQRKDPRIKVFHKDNGGLSDARNHGLLRAGGTYICFIDSDDWIDARFVEVMLGALVDTGADIAECDYLCTEEREIAALSTEVEVPRKIFQGSECFHCFLTGVFFVSVCNKLYRTGILKDQPFRKGVYHEDEYWTYRIFSKARKVCRLDYTGYFYFQRHGSIVHTKPSQKRITDAFTAGKERIDYIEEHHPEFSAIGYSKMMYTCMYLFNEVRGSDIPCKASLQAEIAAYFRIILGKYLKKGQYQKEMWRFCFFRLFPDLYCRQNF